MTQVLDGSDYRKLLRLTLSIQRLSMSTAILSTQSWLVRPECLSIRASRAVMITMYAAKVMIS